MAAPQDFTIEDLLADAQSSGASPLDTAAGLRKWRDDMAAYGRGKHDAEKYWEGIRRLDNDLAPVLENLRDQEANRIIGQLGENRSLFLAQYNKAQGNPDEMAPAFADQARALNALTESKDFAPERVGFASLTTDDGKPLADVVVGRGEALVRPLTGGSAFLVPVEKRSPEEIAKLAEKYKADAATFAQAAEVDTLPITPGSFAAQEGMQSYLKTRARQEQLKADAYATGDPTVIAGYDVGAAIKGQPELLGKIADKDLTDRFQSGLLKASINTARALDDLKDLTYNMGMGGPQDRFAGFEEALAQTNTDTARSFQATTGDTVAASATESLGQMAPTVLPYTAGARLGGLAVREGLAAATMAPASYGQELASMLESAKQAEAAGDPAKANQLRSVARWSAFTQAAIDTGTEMMFPELAGAATGGKGALKRLLTAPLKEGLEEASAGGLERGVKQPAFYPTDMQQPVVEGMATEALAGMAAGGTMSTVQEGGAALLNRRKGEAKKAAVATGDAGTAAAVEEVFDLAQDFATLDSPPATEPPPAQAVVERDSRPEPAVLPPPESVAPQQVERTAEVAPPVEEPGALDAASPPMAVEEPPAVTTPTPVLPEDDSNVGVEAPAGPTASPLGEPITNAIDPTTEGSVPGGVNDLGASTEGPATGSSAPAVSVTQQTPSQETVNVDLPHLRSLASSPTIGANALRHELSYYSPQEREWIARQLGAPDPSPNTLAQMLRYQENGNERFTLTPDRPTANMTEAQARAALGNVPKNVTFINDPEARTPWGTPWAGKANRGTGEVTLNLANISDAADLRSRLNEELAHIVWQDPEVKAAVQILEAAVTPAMRAEMARLGYDAASLTEEAAARLVDKFGRNPDTRSAWRRFLDAVKNALRRLLRLEPTQQQVEQAAREILTYAMSERPAQGSGEMFGQSKDAEYLAAVERGDMETAQRMVDLNEKNNARKPVTLSTPPARLVGKFKPEDVPTLQKIAKKIKEKDDLRREINNGSLGWSWAAYDKRSANIESSLLKIFPSKERDSSGERDVDVAERWLRDNANAQFSDAAGNISERQPRGSGEMFGQSKDAEYLAAVERGDMETAQRMVDDAAKAAGYTIKAFHGTADVFTYFELDHPNRKDSGWLGKGVYLTTSERIARSYSNLKSGRSPKVLGLYARVEKPFEATLRDKQRLQIISHNNGLEAGLEASEKWTSELKQKGYDGVVLNFPASEVGADQASSEYVVFNPNSVKSSDPVTRDESGNVIPLSQRFNDASDDIRYSTYDPREQVFGNRNVGATKPVRSFVESMRVAKETYFDSSLPISESTTATAHRLAAEWADKHTGAQVAAGLLRAANGDELVIGAAQGELHNYAIKLAGTGDASLLNFLQATVNSWAVTDGNEGISSVAALLAGRRPYSQSAFMEAVTQVGVGRRKAETTVLPPEVVDGVTTAVTSTKLGEKEVRRVKRGKKDAKGETLEDKVERTIADKSAEQVLNKFATSQSDTLSWDIRSLEKSKADAVRALIRAALETGSKVKQWDKTWLVQSLVDLGVTPEIAVRLADTTWEERRRRFTLLSLQQQERDAKEAEKQQERDAKAAEREAKAAEHRRLANDRLAQSLVDKYAESQSDTPRTAPPPKVNEIRAIIREALETGKNSEQEGGKQARMWEKQNLIDALTALNVLPRTAQQLADVVWRERANALAIEQAKEAQTVAQKMADLATGERGSLSGLEDALLDAPAAQQQDPGWRRATARAYFSQLGLSPQQAAAAARIYDAEFAERLGDALVAAVERVASQQAPWQEKLKKIGPKQLKKVQTDMDRLRRAVRVGVTHPDTPWHTALAKAHGWKGFTREQNMRLHEIDAQLARHDVLDHEKKRLLNEMQDIVVRANLPPKLADYLAAEYTLSALSGLPTAFVQLSAVFSILRDFFSDVWTSPVVSARTLLASMDSFIGNLSYAGRNDVYNHQVAEHLRGSMPAMRYLLERGLENLQSDSPATKAKGLLHVIVGGLHFVGQFLSAMDEGSIAAAEIYKLSMFTNRALKRLGWTRDQAGVVILASLDARAEALAEAKQSGYRGDEATVVADGIFRRRIHEGMSMADRNIADDIVRGAASEAVGMVGRLNAKTAATDIGSLGIDAEAVSNMDEGMLSRYTVNPILDVLQKLHSKGGIAALAARLAFGFVSVPFRAARWYSSYSPYGLVRYEMNRRRVASGKDTLWKQSFGTRAQEQQRLRDAIVGTLAQVLAVLARSNSGDDDPEKSEIKLIITGKGPVDDAQRMAWSRRFKPYTMYIKMGRTYVPFNMGRLGESVAWSFGLAGALDDVALTKKGRLARNPGLAFRDSAELFGSYYGSLSQRASFQSIGRLFSSANRGGAAQLGDEMFKQATFAGSTFIPWKGALGSLTRLASEPVDQNTMSGVIWSNTPVVGPLFGRPALNPLGDPIGDQTLAGKLYREGFPLIVRFPTDGRDSRVYELILDQGFGPSDPRRYDLERRVGPVTPQQFYEYSRARGQYIKARMDEQYQSLKRMSPEQYGSYIRRISENANAQAAQVIR